MPSFFERRGNELVLKESSASNGRRVASFHGVGNSVFSTMQRKTCRESITNNGISHGRADYDPVNKMRDTAPNPYINLDNADGQSERYS